MQRAQGNVRELTRPTLSSVIDESEELVMNIKLAWACCNQLENLAEIERIGLAGDDELALNKNEHRLSSWRGLHVLGQASNVVCHAARGLCWRWN